MVSVAAVVLLSVLVASTTGAPSGDERIIGGTLVDKDTKYPFMASVELNDPDNLGNNEKRHICGGFIYNDRNIVTAASCVYGRDPSVIFVTVGAISFTNPDPNEQHIGVGKIKTHENYNTTNGFNDIAVITLDRPMTFNQTIAPLYYNDALETDTAGVVMGWGATFDGGLNAVQMREIKVTIYAATGEECNDYTSALYNRNYMICAGSDDGKSSPCKYDEGSPLVLDSGIAVGIMSKNKGCILDATNPVIPPTVYTRLSAYYSWLRANAGQQPAPTTPAPGK